MRCEFVSILLSATLFASSAYAQDGPSSLTAVLSDLRSKDDEVRLRAVEQAGRVLDNTEDAGLRAQFGNTLFKMLDQEADPDR